MSHVDELTFIRYLDRQLPADKAAELEKHTQGCAACLRMFEGLKHETALLRKALVGADEPLPAQFEPRPSEELSWTWLTLLGLAGFGLYTLWNWILVPWREGLQSIGVGQQTLVSVLLFRGLLWEGWSTMAERAMQGLMFIILTVVLITLVRWSVRLRRSWTRMMIALAVTLLLPVTASAAVIETDIENYVLPAGEVLSNDLIVMAHTVLIEGIVEGDLISLAQSTTVTGLVGGDVIALTQKLRIEGKVEGNVRAAAEFHELVGVVTRNVTVFGESVQLHSDGEIGGGLILGAEKSKLDGNIGRDLMSFADRHQVNGRVGGDALLAGGHITLGPNAEIGGDVKVYGDQDPEVSPDANLASEPEVEIWEETPTYASPTTYLWPILKWGAAFVVGLILLLLLPSFFGGVLRRIPRYGISLGVGALVLLVTPVLATFIGLTLVGIPLALAVLVLYVIAIYLGQIFVGAWLGREVLGEPESQGDAVGRLALGLAFIHAVSLLPYIGGLASLAVAVWGLGAITLFIFQGVRQEPVTA